MRKTYIFYCLRMNDNIEQDAENRFPGCLRMMRVADFVPLRN